MFINAATILRAGFVVLNGMSLGACAYTIERKWVPVRSAAEGAFAETLRECVAAHDPDQLRVLEAGGEYRISGWLVDDYRTGPVMRCMRDKGWIAIPTQLLSP